MYHLPKDILRYIYSFDDNIIVKKNKKHALIELKSKFNYKICMSEILIGSSIYDIYLPYYHIKKQKITIHRCLLQRNKRFKKIKNYKKKITNFVIKYISKASINEIKRMTNNTICMSDLSQISDIYNNIYCASNKRFSGSQYILRWLNAKKNGIKKGGTSDWVLEYPINVTISGNC